MSGPSRKRVRELISTDEMTQENKHDNIIITIDNSIQDPIHNSYSGSVFSQYWISGPPPSLHFCTPIPLVSVGQVRPRGKEAERCG